MCCFLLLMLFSRFYIKPKLCSRLRCVRHCIPTWIFSSPRGHTRDVYLCVFVCESACVTKITGFCCCCFFFFFFL